MKNIQLLLDDDEYAVIAAAAEKQNLPVLAYIRRLLLGEKDEFVRAYEEALRRVEALPPGTVFTLKTLFGADWTMRRGTKLTLGKAFYEQFKENPNEERDKNSPPKIAESRGKDKSNIMRYERL